MERVHILLATRIPVVQLISSLDSMEICMRICIWNFIRTTNACRHARIHVSHHLSERLVVHGWHS